ncbi:MAG: flagellar FlbD family protein [Dactylosporangium sp.]|nr:flagellar FlbD family protein [Dactylosporangium sp.]NNJ61289.1 flagellar FlbD family protein [Dactylosporangium sp.]
MILLTRLNGPVFALNPDLVERADCTPDTVITLVDGTKYVVTESLADFVALIRDYRASVVAEAQCLVHNPPPDAGGEAPHQPRPLGDSDGPDRSGTDNVVPLYRRER